MLLRVIKLAATVLGCTLIANVVGVVVCLVADVAPIRHKSVGLGYAIWFVLAVFCGVLTYTLAGTILSKSGDVDWYEKEGADRVGKLIISVTTVLFTALSLLFYQLWWGRGVHGELFIPDSMAPTLMFFIVIIASMAFLRHTFMPVKR